MGSTRLRRPPAPTDAERARSITSRGGRAAALVGTGSPIAHPRAHHVHADGSAVLLLSDDEPVLARVAAHGEVPVMLELADAAPVDLREPVRGLLWITGHIAPVPAERARRIAVGLVEQHPYPAMLELGHGATMVRLTPGSAVLSDAEGTAALSPLDLAAARPDPFCRYERDWLGHLERVHPEVFTALARHLPAPLRDVRDARVRPLGVDRCGLRLRVEAGDRDHDVRLAWEAPIETVEELRTQFQRMVGCPFRQQQSGPAPAG
ncbi:DUF2470 domain-containing protein [Pseudonocardia sp. KRD-184]|uniref:DUF2470 domain-containing protein n=1 Tax=Pseudonocardia oceani TaxID=2792013 RepID=A0ABS6U9C2_9PSEU|nr:DUF2470 domain-containing protein [Pseudonocardia oceani]MBW0093589.1 DUF2470 domain-containing protein [Pseudonocardia oceani]MBW0097648.1 DUF2470 domain-containing protein [Pseudonocardia oceani]MBW0113008.1 DUF2470 domain-containing protein [Pseudonocardia oceani]MBW0125497.1 DUF2470 domain-containing protein [Pseudonocardia oceani]MBW0128830.1 DUF2470 domain-containing protein [Pseudonocardia oceani]